MGLAKAPANARYIAKSPADMVPPNRGRKIRHTKPASAAAASSWMVWALIAFVVIIFRFWRRFLSLAARKRARS